MKSLFAVAVFSLALSLCNLTDRLTKGDRNTNNSNNANTVANDNNANNQNDSNVNNANGNTNRNSNNSNDNTNGNSNLTSNGNGNFGDEEEGDTDGVEEGEVQAALVGVKKRWTQSIIDGDKATCRDVLADGFVNTDPRGAVTNKEQFVSAITPANGAVDAYTITNARLVNQTGESATMTYVVTFTRRGKRTDRWRDTDTFTKRDGRWKIISSASSPAG